jgi:hypothetical protein
MVTNRNLYSMPDSALIVPLYSVTATNYIIIRPKIQALWSNSAVDSIYNNTEGANIVTY